MGPLQRLGAVRPLISSHLPRIESGCVDHEMVDSQIQQVSHQSLKFLEKPDVAAALGGKHMFLMVDVYLNRPAPWVTYDMRSVDTA